MDGSSEGDAVFHVIEKMPYREEGDRLLDARAAVLLDLTSKESQQLRSVVRCEARKAWKRHTKLILLFPVPEQNSSQGSGGWV